MRVHHLVAVAVLAIGVGLGAVVAHAAPIAAEGADQTVVLTPAVDPPSFTHAFSDHMKPPAGTVRVANPSVEVSDPSGGSNILMIQLELSPLLAPAKL